MRSVEIRVDPGHPSFAGHFPGQPLLPGVSLLCEVLEAVLDDPALAGRVGPAPQVSSVKFLAPVRPGALLTLRLTQASRGVQFDVLEGERVAATGRIEP